MAELAVVACPSCGKKNRVDPSRGGAVCGSCRASLEGASPVPTVHPIVDLDDATFRSFVIESPLPVLVDFHATWCPPCKQLAPHVDRVARELGSVVRVAKVDIDRAPDTAARFSVSAVPTLVLVRGPREVSRQEGFAPFPALVTWLEGALK